MNELETLLLRQLQQQQSESEQLVNALSKQLERLQTAQNVQHSENEALRREVRHQQNESAQLVNVLSEQLQRLQTTLNAQQDENDTLRQEIHTERERMQREIEVLRQDIRQSDQHNAAAFDALTRQLNASLGQLNDWEQRLNR